MTDVDPTLAAWIAELERDDADLVLPRFDPEVAWEIGALLRERALALGAPVGIDVRKPGYILFRAALEGSTGDQEEWIRRKSATAFRFETSTALLHARFTAAGFDPTSKPGWLDPQQHVLAGGAVPIRVAGAGVVAVATMSGLSSEDDHRMVAAAIASIRDALAG